MTPLLAAAFLALQTPADLDSITVADGLPSADVRAVAPLADGAVWFGTRDAGVARLEGGRWSYAGPSDGLAGPGVADLLERPGGVVVATGPGGVSRWDDGRWTPVGPMGPLGTPLVFSAAAEAETGALWFGANGGAARWSGEGWEVILPDAGLPHRVVHAAWRDEVGRTWIATRTGLAVVHGRGAGRRVDVPYPGLNARTILPTADGRIWFGTSEGVLVVDGGSRRWLLEGRSVHPMLEDARGRIWAGTDARGVRVFEDGAWWSLTTENGLLHDAVHDVAEGPDGSIWIATGGGVTVWRDRGG